MSHTPGPWYAVGFWVEHPDDDTADICTCNPAAMGQEGRAAHEIEANARLIAAAPDLLDALRGLLAAGDTDARGTFRIRGLAEDAGLMQRARAAIVKATGETE